MDISMLEIEFFALMFLALLNVVFGLVWLLKLGNMKVRFLGSMVLSIDSIFFGFSKIPGNLNEYIFVEGGFVCLAFCALLTTKAYFNVE